MTQLVEYCQNLLFQKETNPDIRDLPELVLPSFLLMFQSAFVSSEYRRGDCRNSAPDHLDPPRLSLTWEDKSRHLGDVCTESVVKSSDEHQATHSALMFHAEKCLCAE